MSRRSASRMRTSTTVVIGVALIMAVGGCGGSDSSSDDTPPTTDDARPVETLAEPPAFVYDVRTAIDAVEAELGSGQQFFEVTANAQFTNVFVAVDDATAAVAYVYVDGALEPPTPKQTGAEGRTFGRDDVDFDPELVVAGVSSDLPELSVDAISVYGDGVGATYVLAATSQAGGFLDIVVGPQGQVFSVDPI